MEKVLGLMTTRVLLLTQWFDPEPTFKGLVFARELVKRGFEVEVVTGFPNYPSGKVYDGYKIRLIQRELIDGVHITRVPLYPSHDGSILKRILNYLTFAIAALFYCLFRAKKADVIYAYHPPLSIGVIAVITRFFRKMPVVYDIQDMWPDTLRATGMLSNEKILQFIGWVAKCIYKRVDKIAVLSPGFKHLLIERGVDESKIEIIPNWCDEQALLHLVIPNEAHNFPINDRLKIVFAGNIGKAQSLHTVINAAEILQNKNVAADFVLIGDGLELNNLKNVVNRKGLHNVIFFPQVPMNVIGTYLKKADALLVHLKKDPLFGITIPSKTQAYMAIGKPILMGVEGDVADIIRRANCGFIFEPENAEALADAVILLALQTKEELDFLGMRANQYYLNNLSVNSGVNQFAKIFDELAIKRVVC